MTPDAPSPTEETAPEAAFWKARYEEERLRLAKLLVAYKDLEAELRRLGRATPAAQPAPMVVPAPVEAKVVTPA